jgi:predicted house-cleaning noncanonical NTP pyrophosphatase (MazG superfamily)
MGLITYNKLVPRQASKAGGHKCVTRTLNAGEYQGALRRKLVEKTAEVEQATDTLAVTRELADVLEVVSALAISYGFSLGDIERERAAKRASRGRFDSRTFLVSVQEQ